MSTSRVKQQLLTQILDMVIDVKEGANKTHIPFLTVNRLSSPTQHMKAVLRPSFCLILQGGKKINFGKELIEYGPGDFAASVIDMPATGHIAHATAQHPYYGLRIDLAVEEIASVVTEAEIDLKRSAKPSVAALVGQASVEILELVRKLLALNNPDQAPFLSNHIKRELIYRLLTGPYAHLFSQRMLFDPSVDGVGKAIEWIRRNFASPLKVENLAELAGSSISSFHHKFKLVTTMGPLQYQKQLRLLEARRLMLGGLMDVATTALEVGYESPSQFNREYKRYFGETPLRDIQSLRGVRK